MSVPSGLGGTGYPSATSVRHVGAGFEADVFCFESGGQKLGDPRHDLAWIRLLTVARSEPDMCQRELQWYEASNFGLDELLPFEVVGAIKILSTISLLRSGRSAVLHAQAASRTDPRFVDYLLSLVRSATGEDVPSPL